LVLEFVIVILLVMLAIVRSIDYLLSKVMFYNTIIESKNVIFFEHVFPLKNKEKLLHKSSVASNKFVDDVQELRRSKRARK
jgi:hypothetical protein